MKLGPEKIVIFGPGGVGKTKLASLLKAIGINPLVIDVEAGSSNLDVQRVPDIAAGERIESWSELRGILQDNRLLEPFGAIVIDSLTKAEEYSVTHTLQTIPLDGGGYTDHIEGYGYGKGYSNNYSTFLTLLGDLDAVNRRGKIIVAICHDCTASVPNPYGEDWIRYEPRLQSTPKASIRHRVREWCDHLLFVGYDVAVNKDGKGMGGGTRTIYPSEMPTHMAKSRRLSTAIPYRDGDAELWKQLFSKGE